MTKNTMKFILGKKVGMTQIFLPNGEVMPVTRVVAGPCTIVLVKNNAVQLGFGEKKEWRLSKPMAGHLKDLANSEFLKEFSIEKTEGLTRGDLVLADTFTDGDSIEVTGISKGKGFAGVVKRHHFRGGPASHGHKDNLRAPGSIGAGGVQRVFKGMRMAGRMGGDQVTIKNLEIIKVDAANNEIFIKGAVPGGRNALVIVRGPGELKITKNVKAENSAKKVETEAPVADVATETANA